MRGWLALFVTFAVAAACNSIADNGKYTICSDDTCGAGSADAGASDSSGGMSSGNTGDGAASCNTSGTPIPKCSQGELDQNIETDPGAPRLIRAPADENSAPFVPNCMVIRAGQSVTWQGDLKDHPIIPREDSTVPNPILTTGPGVSSVTYDFPCPGDYNFSCKNHFNAMLGTIRVIP